MDKKNFFSWILLIALIWVIVGIFLYPGWYYLFFFKGGIFDPTYWFSGISDVIRFLFYRPSYLIILVGIYVLIKLNFLKISFPQLDFFSTIKKFSPIILLSILAAVGIWVIPMQYQDYPSDNLSYSQQIGLSDENKKHLPLDFIYINKDRIDNLFDQIKPELILKERQLETQTEEGKDISNGENPVLNAKDSKKNANKEVSTYSTSEFSEPKKVTLLLDHFSSLNAVKEFQTLLVSIEDVKKLETFRTISQQFQISYDRNVFKQVYDRVIGESLIKENAAMKNLSGQVLVKGDFLISFAGDKVLLKHDYFQIDENDRITFTVSTLNKSEKISSALIDAGNNNKTMHLNVFGKITRIESSNKVTDIYFDAYAIW